ncbi:hypothetical protein ACFSY7_15125 [Kurthia populi]|uniref:Uncharacterized protein n=1 Tax=Kurthia populi TaxID=1562132 RepID=A0ABW5Y3W4_9BACL
MKLQLINDINTLKSTDNATQIELAVVDEQQQFIELTQFKTIVVNIGTSGTLYSSETPTVDTDTNTFSFTLSNVLPVGKYQIQVHLTTHDGKLHIAPHKGAETLTIEKSYNEIDGETIVVMTIQQLLDDMASTLQVAEESNNKSDAAIAKADSAIDIANIATTDAATAITLANEAKSTASSAVTSANNANAKADTAINTANDALTVAQQAIATANSADTKADNAINSASTANDTANDANTKANNAVSTADNAIMIAQQVREEFTHLTEGNTDAELIAARTDEENVTHESLKKRIDSEATKRANGDANTLQSAKDYVDGKVGNIDLSALSTKEETATAVQVAKDYADAKDAVTLQNANDYTDSKVGNIDFSTLATKQENEANLQTAKDYTDNKVSGIDLTPYAKKDEVNTMIGDTSTLVTNDKTIVGAINEVASNSGGSSAKVYGIKIDTTNSNPETALTYIDDATDFTPARMNFATDTFEYGSWANKFPFNQIKPCLSKDGAVVGYLNPNDYSKFVDGTSADITSGNSGDVMIEFPIVYWKFNTLGNYLYIRYSDTKIDDGYKCLAHMRGAEVRDKCYVSAYLGYELNGKLRSLSGKTPTGSKTIGAFRTLAQANGAGYDQMAYYQLLMLQVLYIVMFKDRDSQTALGRGYVDGNSAATTTGKLNDKGLFYGETTGKKQMKFCGVEDFYGNMFYWIDGIATDSAYKILINNQSFNGTGSGYTTSIASGLTADTSGYIDQVQGGTESGFIIKSKAGSNTTYYADYGDLYASCVAFFGGSWINASPAGAFHLGVTYSVSSAHPNFGARLLAL